jgi:hypothetical protein
MGLRILKLADFLAELKERIIIYGRAGIGKTRLALSLPYEKYGKIAYYASDTNSEFLSSIDPSKRDRIIVVKPEGDDPISNFMKFCMQDWSAIDPEIKTLVVDTYTKVALDIISYAANSGTMDREKHFIIGDPAEGGQAIPNRGDYQGIESVSRGNLNMIFAKQRTMHIIFLMHEDVKIIENVHAIGGPAHPGRAMTEYIPAQFSTVIRLIRDKMLTPGADAPEDVVIAITENDGKFIAKIRTSNERSNNVLARVALDRDPSSYWVQYDADNTHTPAPVAVSA